MIWLQSQVDRLVKSKDDQIEFVAHENARLRLALDAEKKRADAAVDDILRMKGASPITPMVIKDQTPFDRELERAAKVLSSIGGDVPGMPEEEEKEANAPRS